jgi:hypothetical protein
MLHAHEPASQMATVQPSTSEYVHTTVLSPRDSSIQGCARPGVHLPAARFSRPGGRIPGPHLLPRRAPVYVFCVLPLVHAHAPPLPIQAIDH